MAASETSRRIILWFREVILGSAVYGRRDVSLADTVESSSVLAGRRNRSADYAAVVARVGVRLDMGKRAKGKHKSRIQVSPDGNSSERG